MNLGRHNGAVFTGNRDDRFFQYLSDRTTNYCGSYCGSGTGTVLGGTALARRGGRGVVLTTGGGPAGSTNVLVFELYRNAFEYFNMGYAAAMAYFLFAILFALTLLQFRFVGSRVQYT